jgi:hypothetical protein
MARLALTMLVRACDDRHVMSLVNFAIKWIVPFWVIMGLHAVVLAATAPNQALLTILRETAAIAETTNRLALLVFGGSVAVLVSTSYLQPNERRVRLVYLLFIPGWFALMWAIFRGQQVSSVYISAMHVANKPELFYKLEVLWRLEEQSAALYLSLVPFSLWLVIFLVWWRGRL